MKKTKFALIALGIVLSCAFSAGPVGSAQPAGPVGTAQPAGHVEKKIPLFFWFTPGGMLIDYNTLGAEEVTTGFTTNPSGGTLQLEGWTQETPGGQPAGTLKYKLYSHP